MIKIATFVLLLTDAVLSDGFFFPDQVSSKANYESLDGDDRGRGHLNSYGNSFTDQGNYRPTGDDRHRHRPAFNEHYDGNIGGFVPGFGNHHGHDNRVHRGNRPYHGGIISQSEANAQSTGFGSQANAQSGSQFFNQGSQSSAQAQAQSQGYNPAYPFGPNGGGSGSSSASSAASATSGIVDGVATASAAAAASSGGGGSASSSSSSSSSSGNNGGFVNGQSQLPPWFFGSRVAGENGDGGSANADASSAAAGGLGDEQLVFSN